ncbi:dihydroorotase [Desulfotomaculum arcticum]|uniref:Dihydroorotase n=1 Tax=Desulfotruncus arcticus DSM 17038 TaxID=1121424 RepID=A0A1I2XXT3_9FIRM|nr:dihydroorotase [Desulfotruncus arcticus]SFH18298.1 dihydroorotase [Desulfotomaculum arcticum] [Desulfotruncus arcticus DSM 17038]
MKMIIRGGRVLDPVSKRDETADLYIQNDIITPPFEVDSGTRIIDAAGRLVAPGFIDMHVHLREPGFEAKETIATGVAAAVRGGFTGVACMPNTNPVTDNATIIEYIKSKALEAGLAGVYPVGAITRGSRGGEMAELAGMREAGAAAFSDDGQPVKDAGMMRLAMQYCKMLGAVIISHCEEKNLVAGGVMHEGYYSTILGLKGIPAAAEEVMVSRDIILAAETGCPVHIAHISTAGSVALVREAKKRGISVTAEATPHHFSLTDGAVVDYSTNAKVNPPLRGEADLRAVLAGLADGTIDVIATDHAPHTHDEKNVEFDLAPFGLVGLETAVGLVWSELVHKGVLTPLQAVAKLSLNPASILGINRGTLSEGAAADITIIDPNLEETVDPGKFAGKGRNTPFTGRKLKGLPVMTIVSGEIKYVKESEVRSQESE